MRDSKTARTVSAYLSLLAVGAEVFFNIKRGAEEFRLPELANNVLLIIITAGTSRIPHLREPHPLLVY
jgi:hypothetical protein